MSDIYKKLKADFPKEAYQKDSSRGFDLTSIKAQYVVERLNDVLGINGWKIEGEFKDVDTGVLLVGTLSFKIGDEWHSKLGVGYADKKKNMGDTYKGAMTDLISKAASHIGVGNEVFKGNVNAHLIPDSKSQSKSSKPNTWRSKNTTASKAESASGTGDFA